MLVAGISCNRLAVERRGEDTADTVSADDWNYIEAQFCRADSFLEHALSTNFAPGAAITAMMMHQMIHGDRAVAERMFIEAQHRTPTWLPAWVRIQAMREPRWGGSLEEMEALLDEGKTFLCAEDLAELTARHWAWQADSAWVWENRLPHALRLMSKALEVETHPQHRAALLDEYAEMLDARGHAEQAIVAARGAVALDPKAAYYWRLGELLFEAGEFAQSAEAYEKGGVKKSEKAFDCAKKAARLFAFNARIEGLARDRVRSVNAYTRALALASNDDQRRFCLNGIGCEWINTAPIDPAKAEEVFIEGVALGDRHCAHNLAHLLVYLKRSDPETQRRITDLFRIAASKGCADSMRQLAARLESGVGADANPEEARKWRERAATIVEVKPREPTIGAAAKELAASSARLGLRVLSSLRDRIAG